MSKNCCGGKIDLSKLGNCPFCITSSIISNIIFWSAYFILKLYYSFPFWLSLVILIFNFTLALLLFAHIISYFSKRK